MHLRMPLIAGNWKMNKNCEEAVNDAQRLVSAVSLVKGVEIFIAPAFTALYAVGIVLRNSNVSMAAQDIFWEKNGAFTGEVSADMIKEVGCSYVIIGHSERRQFCCETDEIVNKKIKVALIANIYPVLCVGETQLDREEGKMFSVVDKQIREGLEGVPLGDLFRIILAYEPIWAIGTGDTATDYQVQEMHSFIRSCLGDLYPPGAVESVRIIYGGSVNLDNLTQMMVLPDVDGALVGGASLKPGDFGKLICLGERSKLVERG